jgi:hypothetical protein
MNPFFIFSGNVTQGRGWGVEVQMKRKKVVSCGDGGRGGGGEVAPLIQDPLLALQRGEQRICWRSGERAQLIRLPNHCGYRRIDGLMVGTRIIIKWSHLEDMVVELQQNNLAAGMCGQLRIDFSELQLFEG